MQDILGAIQRLEVVMLGVHVDDYTKYDGIQWLNNTLSLLTLSLGMPQHDTVKWDDTFENIKSRLRDIKAKINRTIAEYSPSDGWEDVKYRLLKKFMVTLATISDETCEVEAYEIMRRELTVPLNFTNLENTLIRYNMMLERHGYRSLLQSDSQALLGYTFMVSLRHVYSTYIVDNEGSPFYPIFSRVYAILNEHDFDPIGIGQPILNMLNAYHFPSQPEDEFDAVQGYEDDVLSEVATEEAMSSDSD